MNCLVFTVNDMRLEHWDGYWDMFFEDQMAECCNEFK